MKQDERSTFDNIAIITYFLVMMVCLTCVLLTVAGLVVVFVLTPLFHYLANMVGAIPAAVYMILAIVIIVLTIRGSVVANRQNY